jgi:hypothetical protein
LASSELNIFLAINTGIELTETFDTNAAMLQSELTETKKVALAAGQLPQENTRSTI